MCVCFRPIAPLAHLFSTSPTISAGWATACSGAAGDGSRQQHGRRTNPLLEWSATMKLACSSRRTVHCILFLLPLKHRHLGSCCLNHRHTDSCCSIRQLRPLRQVHRLMPDLLFSLVKAYEYRILGEHATAAPVPELFLKPRRQLLAARPPG